MTLLSPRILAWTLCVVYLSTFVSCKDELILTPHLEAGKIKEAQNKAKVTPDFGGEKSYSGFFTVNKKCDSNLFFWYFPAKKNSKDAPVVLWLNGGPGYSSLFGLFTEIGPFNYIKGKGFIKNPYSWTNEFNVIFLDQPAGTGFSYTTKGCYAEDFDTLTKDASSFIWQFFTLFPELQKNKFFIAGDGFSGISIPAIAYEVDQRNEKENSKVKVNLKGVLVGSPDIDKRCTLPSNSVYYIGAVDEKQRDELKKIESLFVKYITVKNYTGAAEIETSEIDLILNETGLVDSYNFLSDLNEWKTDFPGYLKTPAVRKQIHVGDQKYIGDSEDEDGTVFNKALKIRYTVASPYYEKLLASNKYIVGFWGGDLDYISPYVSVECVLRRLKWPGADGYKAASRSKWYVGDRLAGWCKVAGNLFECVARAAGHFVPRDQPKVMLDYIKAAVAGEPGKEQLTTLKTTPKKKN